MNNNIVINNATNFIGINADISASDFGSYIRFLRNKANLSQKELAEKTGLSTSELSKLENGERQKPSVKYLNCLAPCLNVSVQDLLYRAGYIDDVWDDKELAMDKSFMDTSGKPINMSYLVKSIYDVDRDLLPLLKKLTDSYRDDDLEIIKNVIQALTADEISKDEKNAILIFLSKFLKVI